MDELRRSEYLQAMGTDSYVSRSQLPGAALTRRLALVSAPGSLALPVADAAVASVSGRRVLPAAMPRLDSEGAAPRRAPVGAASTPVAQAQAPRFSLVAITCGSLLWLEELEAGLLLTGQIQLVQAMASALENLISAADSARPESKPQTTQFDWPIHNNRQLDQGQDAARASVTGFIQRKLEQGRCQGLVLLGSACETRVDLQQLVCPRIARTVGTSAMLRDPLLKKQAWRDLRPFFQAE